MTERFEDFHRFYECGGVPSSMPSILIDWMEGCRTVASRTSDEPSTAAILPALDQALRPDVRR